MNSKAVSVNQLDIFGDICRNNHGGNENSTKAFQDNRMRSRKQCLLLMKLIEESGDVGRTADELTIESELYIQTVSARCSELRRKEFVVEIGSRKTRRGSFAAVLTLSEKGREFLAKGGRL